MLIREASRELPKRGVKRPMKATSKMKTVRFGIIGCGLMGREFASAAARWCHLTEMDLRPEIVAICNRSLTRQKIDWYTDNFPTIKQVTGDYRNLLANPEIEAVYIAVPHNLHEQFYCDALEAGKHLLGEKPFGIDIEANKAILKAAEANSGCRAACSSQFIYYPAVQQILHMLEEGQFGRIIEVDSGFLHCSDLNPQKPINWKRTLELNGEYGVMGDLGPHVALVPFRAGWQVENTRAICTNIITERPNGNGELVPCRTWDNAAVLSQLRDPRTGESFPWTLRAHRIMPGEKNTWYLGIYGTKASARFSLKNPRRLQILRYTGGEQAWQNIDMGFETAYKTISANTFEFGASDAFMQMMAAFMYELSQGRPLSKSAACPTPREMHSCHRLFTAALESHKTGRTVTL
jgi:predicted dehydrogenase